MCHLLTSNECPAPSDMPVLDNFPLLVGNGMGVKGGEGASSVICMLSETSEIFGHRKICPF